MGTPNRAALLVKTHKMLKKHYVPVAAIERPLLEQLLFALCLENTSYEAAEKAFAELRKNYFDWNEIRVTTVVELAETIASVQDARAQAANLKRALQGVFETTYSFDLEAFKKKNIGQAIKDLEKISGVTRFASAYITQASLGGHAIPIDKGAMESLLILGVVSPKEAETGAVPGLERAIPKNKGAEFGSLIHQLGVELLARPFSTEVRELFLSMAPDCKDRLPKRGVKKEPEAARAAKADAATAKEKAEKDGKGGKPEATKGEAAKVDAAKSAASKTAASKKPEPPPHLGKDKAGASDKSHGEKVAGKAKDEKAKEDKVKDEKSKSKDAKSGKKDSGKKPPATPAKGAEKSAASKGLSKSKPR